MVGVNKNMCRGIIRVLGKLCCISFTETALSVISSYSAGIDFRRQNLTSIDVRFRRLKTVPALKELKYLY